MTGKAKHLGERKVSKLEYILLSGQDVREEFYRRHDGAFRLWRRSWEQTFTELKSSAKVSADDFVRQAVIGGLFDGENPVGLLLHCSLNLNLEAVRSHGYLSTYPPAVIDRLRAEGAARVLSMEYLTLHDDWRKARVGVPLAPVLLGLGVKAFEGSGYPAMIVVTRNDRKVNDILYGFGARCLVPNLTKHNVFVDIVALERGKTHAGPDPEVNRWIEYFWERRVDASAGPEQELKAA